MSQSKESRGTPHVIAILLGLLIVAVAVFLVVQGMRSTAAPQNQPPAATSDAQPYVRDYELASPPGDRSITISLITNKDFAEHGQVELRDVNGRLRVTLTLWGDLDIGFSYPAYIHEGDCNSLGIQKYVLTPLRDNELPVVPDFVLDGTPVKQSVATLDMSVDDLVSQFPLSINVRPEEREHNVSVACAPLVRF